jgi:hypothetical protein
VENSLIRPSQKFTVRINGKTEVVYYIDAIPRVVLKVDGEHRYYWYRDPQIDIASMQPLRHLQGARHEIHETECISDRTDIP